MGSDTKAGEQPVREREIKVRDHECPDCGMPCPDCIDAIIAASSEPQTACEECGHTMPHEWLVNDEVVCPSECPECREPQPAPAPKCPHGCPSDGDVFGPDCDEVCASPPTPRPQEEPMVPLDSPDSVPQELLEFEERGFERINRRDKPEPAQPGAAPRVLCYCNLTGTIPHVHEPEVAQRCEKCWHIVVPKGGGWFFCQESGCTCDGCTPQPEAEALARGEVVFMLPGKMPTELRHRHDSEGSCAACWVNRLAAAHATAEREAAALRERLKLAEQMAAVLREFRSYYIFDNRLGPDTPSNAKLFANTEIQRVDAALSAWRAAAQG